VAWGNNSSGLASVPADLTNAIAIAAGGSHSLALRADGTVVAWGGNQYGQTLVPLPLRDIIAIAAAEDHSLALRADGRVVAWGRDISVPTSLTNVTAIATGRYHSLAMHTDGSVTAWGLGFYGQTNIPPTLVNACDVVAGGNHSLARRADGRIVAWGDNSYGQTWIPTSLTNALAVAAGDGHNLALRPDGRVAAWGRNSYGQTTIPAGLTNCIVIAAGSGHSLAVRADGRVVAWGLNSGGQTVVPAGLTNVFALAAGGSYSLAICTVPPATNSLVPPQIVQSPASVVVRVGAPASFSVVANGELPLSYQWRRNGYDVAGATTTRLALVAAVTPDAGSYDVVVASGCGSATSAAATLTVTTPGRITAISVQPGGAVQVGAVGVAGRDLLFSTSTNLLDWTPWISAPNPSGQVQVLDPAPCAPQKFYRVDQL